MILQIQRRGHSQSIVWLGGMVHVDLSQRKNPELIHIIDRLLQFLNSACFFEVNLKGGVCAFTQVSSKNKKSEVKQWLRLQSQGHFRLYLPEVCIGPGKHNSAEKKIRQTVSANMAPRNKNIKLIQFHHFSWNTLYPGIYFHL